MHSGKRLQKEGGLKIELLPEQKMEWLKIGEQLWMGGP
jgi:hypothetical protein